MNSPAIEAAEMVEKLGARDQRLGMALTSLRKLIRVSVLVPTLRELGVLTASRKSNLQKSSSIGTVCTS